MGVLLCCESIACIPARDNIHVTDCPPLTPPHYPPAQSGILANPFSITQDSSKVYVGTNNNPAIIYRIVKSTMAVEESVFIADANAVDVAVDSTFLYVIARDAAGTDNARVHRYQKDNFAAGATILALGRTLGSSVLLDSGNPNILYAMTSAQASPGTLGSMLHRIDVPTFTIIDSTPVWTPGNTLSPYTGVNYAGLCNTPSRLAQNSTHLFFGNASPYGSQTPSAVTRVLKSNPATFTILAFDPVGPGAGSFASPACDASFVWLQKQTAFPQGMARIALSNFQTFIYLAAVVAGNSNNAFAVSRELTATAVLTGVSFIPVATAQRASVLKDLSAIALNPFPVAGERIARGICYDAVTDNRYDLGIENVFLQGRCYRS